MTVAQKIKMNWMRHVVPRIFYTQRGTSTIPPTSLKTSGVIRRTLPTGPTLDHFIQASVKHDNSSIPGQTSETSVDDSVDVGVDDDDVPTHGSTSCHSPTHVQRTKAAHVRLPEWYQ